jgi:hypothetical protein
VTVKEGVNKSTYPIQNPLLLVAEHRALENMMKSFAGHPVT